MCELTATIPTTRNVVPSLIHIRLIPSVLERRPRRLAPNRRRVVPIRVERRFELNGGSR